MTVLIAATVAVLVGVALVDGAGRLIRKGFDDGDRPEDPRSEVVALGDGRASIRVENWSESPIGVSVLFTGRPADRFLAWAMAPVAKSTWSGGSEPVQRLGTVQAGADGAWIVDVPGGTTRAGVLLDTGGPAGRTRLHRHLLAGRHPDAGRSGPDGSRPGITTTR